MRTEIRNILMTPGVTDEPHIPFLRSAVIQIDGNRIVYAGREAEAPAFEADKTIDGKGALAMPGLCNMHTHTPMTLLRGVGSDLPLDRWLNEAVFPVERQLTDEAVGAGTDLGLMEMIRYGTTSFNDMYMHMEPMVQSVLNSGMRAMLGYSVVDFDESLKDTIPSVEFLDKWSRYPGGLLKCNVSPHSEGATTPKAMRELLRESVAYDLPIHVHVSETKLDRDGSLERRGVTPPQYLEKLGVLERPVIAAHCVWFNDEDIQLFAQRGVTIVHNPVSNLKLASGVAPIAKMLKAGCKVALGTDGVASNNNLNLWEEIKLMAILHKGVDLDPTVVSPAQTIAAATSVGAKALGFDDLGLLKPGYLADIILVDVHGANCCPNNDLESDLVYAVQGSDVTMTMVDGKVLYQDGVFTTLEPALVLSRAQKECEALMERTRNNR